MRERGREGWSAMMSSAETTHMQSKCIKVNYSEKNTIFDYTVFTEPIIGETS